MENTCNPSMWVAILAFTGLRQYQPRQCSQTLHKHQPPSFLNWTVEHNRSLVVKKRKHIWLQSKTLSQKYKSNILCFINLFLFLLFEGSRVKLDSCLSLTNAEITGIIHAVLKVFVLTNSNKENKEILSIFQMYCNIAKNSNHPQYKQFPFPLTAQNSFFPLSLPTHTHYTLCQLRNYFKVTVKIQNKTIQRKEKI